MKRKKTLPLLLTVLAVLAGLTVLVTRLNSQEETPQSMQVFAAAPEAMTRLSWGEVTLVKTGDGWAVENHPDFPLDGAKAEAAAAALREVKASRVLEDVADLAEFGLDQPASTISVTADTTGVLNLGNTSGLGAERYCSNGDGKVYLVEAALLDSFPARLSDLAVREEIPDLSTAVRLDWQSPESPFTLEVLEKSRNTYTSRYTWFAGGMTLDNELVKELAGKVAGLRWADCVAYAPADPATYGLDTPRVLDVTYLKTQEEALGEFNEAGEELTATMVWEESFCLEIGGRTEDGAYYARPQGSALVYTVDAAYVDALNAVDVNAMRPDEVLLVDWNALQTMDVTVGGNTVSLTRKQKTYINSSNQEVTQVQYLRGEEIVDGQAVTDALDGLRVTGYADEAQPLGDALAVLVLNLDDPTYPQVTLAVYVAQDRCLCAINGEATAYISGEAGAGLLETLRTVLPE